MAETTKPNQQRWHAKVEARSEQVHVAYTFVARFGPDLHTQSVLINENFCVGAQVDVY